MGTRTHRTVLIGQGNVATLLAERIDAEHFPLTKVGGRQRLCPIPKDADLYIIAVSDRAIRSVAEEIGAVEGLVVHTAGSVPMSILPQQRRGVLYPLQTVSKNRELSSLQVPLFIEASSDADLPLLEELAHGISTSVTPLDSDGRRKLHLSAVFCCNFVNRLYGIAGDLLSSEGLPFKLLLPLIRETASKVEYLSPSEAQTGPAVRWDTEVMDYQCSQLPNEDLKALYKLMSKLIHDDKLRLEKHTSTRL